MGRSTCCAVAPFAIKGTALSNIISVLVKEDGDKEPGLEKTWDADGIIIPVLKDGWKFYNDSADEFKDQNGNILYCDNLDKDGMKLYIVNEHEYSNVGEEAYCVFGFSGEALRQLRVDWDLLKTKIRINDVIQQTM